MRALPDQYESLKADCCLYPANYVSMTNSQLDTKALGWAISKDIVNPSSMPASVAAGSGLAAKSPPAASPAPAPLVFTHKQICCMAKEGYCICKRKDGHKFENCNQFMLAGYVIEHNPEKAKEKRAATPGHPPPRRRRLKRT